jgi:hypothetical protein
VWPKIHSPVLRLLVLLVFAGYVPRARADVTVLLEEPYSYDGAFAGTGHTAVYLTRICAATPVTLRRCGPGERGAVISRYARIAGYDWIAIPLVPYLYAVDDSRDIPLFADPKMVALLRDRYRRAELEKLAPDGPDGGTPNGDWYELVGSAYDRTNYGFEIKTTAEQDDAFIAWMNSRPNRADYQFIARNCADFVREVLNFYYPHSESRGNIADLFVSTPKHAAKSLVKYSRRHEDLEFTHFVIPQVPGTVRRSRPVHGVVESVFRAKKYVAVLAALHPVVTGGVVSVYLLGDRFDPAKGAEVLMASGELRAAPTEDERRAYVKGLRALEAEDEDVGAKQSGKAWRSFVERSHPAFGADGQAVLEEASSPENLQLGVTRANLQIESAPMEVQRQMMISRLTQELGRSRSARISSSELREDWQLLEKLEAARRAGISEKSALKGPPPMPRSAQSSD